jgi:hypothetical protein
MHDAVELEGRGIPTVVLCTEVFMDSAVAHAVAYGLPEARVVSVQHPLAAIAPQAVAARADAVIDRIIAQLVGTCAD